MAKGAKYRNIRRVTGIVKGVKHKHEEIPAMTAYYPKDTKGNPVMEVSYKPVLDKNGWQVFDKKGRPKTRRIEKPKRLLFDFGKNDAASLD